MSTVKIFVEGIADEKFLLDYIEHILPESAIKNYNIINAEGWGINKKTQQIMQRNTDEGGVNLVVFDADIDFESKKKEIEKWRSDFNLSFELFLFPNNRDNGTLENLLEEIIPEKNRPISDCWEGYEKCLKSKTIEGREKPLTTPAKKNKDIRLSGSLVGRQQKREGKNQREGKRLWEYRSLGFRPYLNTASMLRRMKEIMGIPIIGI